MQELTCDLVVLGGGGGGLTAAVRAAQKAKLSVIVLEKADYLGGGAIQAGGFAAYGSQYYKELGLEDHLQEHLLRAMDDTKWLLDPQLVYRAFLASGAFFDWHLTLEDDVKDCYSVSRGGPMGFGGALNYNGKHGGRGGTYVMKLLARTAEKLGVQILLNSRAADVELEKGKLSAVIAETPEGSVRIHCRACVLATGSWINNFEVLGKVYPEFAAIDPGELKRGGHRSRAYTGDGFALAEQAGAFIDWAGLAVNVGGPMTIAPCDTLAVMCSHPYSLEINLEGNRWACEPSNERTNSGYQLARQPEGTTYVLCDRNTINKAAEELARNPDAARSAGPMGMRVSFPKDIDADLRMAVEGKNKGPVMPGVGGIGAPGSDDDDGLPPVVGKSIYYGETLEEMAESMGVPADSFRETIRHYNACCEAGFDDRFFKPAENLVPLTGPFYAVRSAAGSDGAFGGVKVNARMQAWAADGGLVDGLYVVGDFASGRFINDLGEKKQILHDLTWAFASGFIAADSVAEDLGNCP